MAIVYHPPAPATTNNGNIRDHFFNSLSLAESKYPNCALIVCGDCNRLDVQPILDHFRLKQIVKVTTRKNAILDLMLTNLHVFYDNPSSYPPFGLSDHNTVLCSPKTKKKTEKTTKFILKRDLRSSRKAELGRYLANIDWRVLFGGLNNCEEYLQAFQSVVCTGFDLLMPLKRVRINITDAPWMTSELNSLISKRQRAFHDHGPQSILFKTYRNAVNRKRKNCKATFYESKVDGMKEKDPKAWWKEVKRPSGALKSSSNLIPPLEIEELEGLPMCEMANRVIRAPGRVVYQERFRSFLSKTRAHSS